jgi:hypothetical protein
MKKLFPFLISTTGLVIAVFVSGCQPSQTSAEKTDVNKTETPKAKEETPKTKTEPRQTLADFQKEAAKFNSVLALPSLEQTPEAVKASVTNAISTANAALDRVGKLGPNEVTFTNTVKALDDLGYQAGLTAIRLGLAKETSTDAGIREAATDAEPLRTAAWE